MSRPGRIAPVLLAHGAMAALMFVPMPASAPVAGAIPHVDKLVHFAVWLMLALMTGLAPRVRGARRFAPWSCVIVLLALEGVVVELLQGLTPSRSADPWDAATDALGAAVGALIGWSRARRRDDGV